MNDTEVISWMHHLAVSADSDVLADDLHSLANSFSEYAENGAIDDEIESLESDFQRDELDEYYSVMDKHDVYGWLVDELNERGVNNSHDNVAFTVFPLSATDKKSNAVKISQSVAYDIELPDAPDGWEWKSYGSRKQKNYLVKKEDSDEGFNPLSTVSDDPDIDTYNEARSWLEQMFGPRCEYGRANVYVAYDGFREAVYVEGVDIDDWPASPDGWRWKDNRELNNRLYLIKDD